MLVPIEELLRMRNEIDEFIREHYTHKVTVLFSDIVGSTEYFSSKGDIAGRAMVQRHNDLLFPIIEKHYGRIIKTIGDAIMAGFDEVANGVSGAIAMQQQLAKHNQNRDDEIHIRIGIHIGKALTEPTDIYGDTVNVAARIAALANGDQILISEATFKETKGFRTHYHGDYSLKGLKERIPVYEVLWYEGQKPKGPKSENDKELLPKEKGELTRRYLEFIRTRYEAIPCLAEGVCLTMKNYIPLKVGEVRKEERPNEKREGEPKETKDIDFRVWREEHSLDEIHSLTPVDVEIAIRNKRIVVKGDPGSGKTTLTRYIAFKFASLHPTNLIPLLIDLKDWAGKGTIPLPEYYAKDVLKGTGFEKRIEPLIEDWLKSGRCIILCDGLDEVTQQNKESIIQSLQNIGSGEYRNCHILVTTRIVGYNNELSGWRHYEVMSLVKENIEQYAKDYLKDKSQAFLSALNRTPQMVPLSKNPLLLQILCFVFDKQRLVLPTHRVKLYKSAVHQMQGLREPKIPFSIKENILQEIAVHLLEGKEVFEEEEIRDIIKDYLKKKDEKYEPDDVLKELREKSGLLCQLSDNRYIFLHLTFQEYLCACYIVGQASCLSLLEPVFFNPRFREVVRLTAGMLPKEKAWEFINFILSQKPLCYDILPQPLLLAGVVLLYS